MERCFPRVHSLCQNLRRLVSVLVGEVVVRTKYRHVVVQQVDRRFLRHNAVVAKRRIGIQGVILHGGSRRAIFVPPIRVRVYVSVNHIINVELRLSAIDDALQGAHGVEPVPDIEHTDAVVMIFVQKRAHVHVNYVFCFCFCKHSRRKEENCLKLTRHNGRSGKHGTYNPRHNDRRFDVENSEHIDAERARQNVYWDCYRGFTTHEFRENPEQPDFSFEEIERMYYYEHYGGYVEAQNARNEKTRHTERNRTVEDLLKNNKTCPEESIYQIGTMGESVPPDMLFSIVNEFYEEFERRFGSHIHILDWALHLDEGTPHIHERHVFDCENRYGELCPQQEKALEELGIPLPNPEKPKGRNNNRKQTFDAVCRTILFDIARRHGLHLDQEPSYGGRDYLEKQDYILMKQKEQLAAQEQKLEELTLKIEDVETLLDDVSDAAYDKAVEVVTDTVRQETHKEDIRLVEESKKWVLSPERKAPKKEREYAAERLDGVITKIKNAMQHALAKIQRTLMQTEVKQAGKEQIKKKAKESIMDKLAKAKINADRDNRERWEREGRIAPTKKNDMEL